MLPGCGRQSVSPTVVLSPEAETDLQGIDDHVAERAGTTRALGYVERILAHCEGFATFPERGRRRDDLRPGLRVTGFERRVTIAFHCTVDQVVID
ncbi:type II toxin-antitoxin system RelE/ParE family toxin [Methylobacterium sp. SyP6R]|uniref:type II toxin-antitoxin system RelE/ParE family toxin n=1 Tax=Methylobacterium sp. SyP6R TaxID=2718876 RepID=UPI001F1DC446|nr:type II toxin-antitoxin system RelE/ParE family toxin [Methylobacterium sp. SyP6R]MCF4128550.1 type II toxin-antitoxin system RelE/ParE family toxin [Methylobacterium sp. SyP6R]